MLLRTLLLAGALLTCWGVQATEWLIDVRTAEEYSVEHVSGAKNIEFQQIVPEVSKLGIGKQEPIQLYCRSGRRAEIARRALMQEGFQRVTNLGSVTAAKTKVQGESREN